MIDKVKPPIFKLISTIFIWFSLSNYTYAAELSATEVSNSLGHLIRPKSFTLFNSADNDLTFYLTSKHLDRTEFRLRQNSNKEFSDSSSTQYLIEVPTSVQNRTQSVRYSLSSGKRYKLYWNYSQARWDISEMDFR